MTAGTIRRGAGVVEIGRYPGGGGMAGFAIIAAVDMRRMLTRGSGTIVTTEAAADHVSVVYPNYRGPGGIAVTVFTQIVGGDMGRSLPGSC